jgi:acetyltransferase-like isoleucine patch superfamily enzyme
MANLFYLWKNRAKFSISSIQFYAAWAKRILTFKSLVRRNRNRNRLNRKGANIHPTSEIGNMRADGKKKNLTVGANSFIGTAIFTLHHQVQIGNNVCINDGVTILTASHNVSDPEWKNTKAPVIIDDFVWIAQDAFILPGVTIGRGAVVGARAVVSKNVAPYQIVVGNPAQAIPKKRVEELNYNPCQSLADNLAWLKG